MEIAKGYRKLKGNISVMVILILLACSLFGILTIIFLRSLIIYTDDSYGYYKSYYMAKAGLELALTEIDNTDVGFENSVNSGDAIIINNFDCPGCSFTSEIKGRSTLISNNFWQTTECDDDNKLTIPVGGSMVLPMFYDDSKNFSELVSYSKCLSGNVCQNLFNKRNGLSIEGDLSQDLNIGVIFLNGDDISIEYLFMQPFDMINLFNSYFEAFKRHYNDIGWNTLLDNIGKNNLLPYIVLSNPDNSEVKFCIKSEVERPTSKYFVYSIGEYMGKTVGLQAIYEQPVPSFLINPYISLSNNDQAVYNYQYAR